MIIRAGKNQIIKVVTNEGIKEVPYKMVCKEYGIDGCIRIQKDELENIDLNLSYFTHFNLQASGHKIGEVYGLPIIIDPGYYINQYEEVLPILSFKKLTKGKCIEVKNEVPYVRLTEEDFEYSMQHIKNTDQLKKAILKRYKKSLPSLSDKKILSAGVAITKLKLI